MTEPPEAAPTMNDLIRAKPAPKHAIFAEYRVEDTEQDPENTETGTTEETQ